MSQTAAVNSTPRIGSVVAMLDRLFPLVWIGIYALLPVSGWASEMFESWHDQQLFLDALRSVLAEGRADTIADNIVGPAYVAAAALIHHVLGLSPESSLVALSRGAYVLSVAGGMVLVRVVVQRLPGVPPLASLAAQVLFGATVFAAGTWHWSDVPWSHFFAACLAMALYVLRYVPRRVTVAQSAGIGSVVALLALTRTFELAAFVAAWAIALVLLGALRLTTLRRAGLRYFAAGACAFVATVAAVSLATGKNDAFVLYGQNLDRQAAAVLPAEVARTPTFSPELVPIKLVQLFVEPCFYSLCSVSDYAGATQQLPPGLAGAEGSDRLWRLPLAIQLPTLVFLPLCIVTMIVLVAWFARHRASASGKERELRLLAELTLAASGIVLGYTASTLTGSAHLRWGFAREFMLPSLLTAVVAVSLASAGIWVILSRASARGRRPSPEFGFVVLAVVASAAVVSGTAYARAHGLPRIESRQLGTVEYTASCRGSRCVVSVSARTRAGRPISIPESSTLTFGCGSDKARFTIYASSLSGGVQLTHRCTGPRLVAAWPTVMGLPPGSYELAAVAVKNAS